MLINLISKTQIVINSLITKKKFKNLHLFDKLNQIYENAYKFDLNQLDDIQECTFAICH